MTKQMLLGDCFEVERNISRVGKTVKKSDRFDTEPTFSNISRPPAAWTAESLTPGRS